ncbi:MAG: hypothetical protein KME05_11580 [Gloeocapsa sp. UFS-A4-WI-NPMV-4B04]|nr:hypothetical protein [Gloeocapsa sp. UFS-A4-WI-NPMV-4B04]
MSTQAPQLDKGEMAAAERANLQLSEQIIVLMAKTLREYAKNYPPKLRKTLSDPNAETKVDISVGNEKLLSATLGTNNKLKETQINTITDSQAQELQKALSKHKGETLDVSGMRDMRVLVNGVALFEAKSGKVTQNNLPPEFQKAIAAMVKPKPMEVSLSTNSPKQQYKEQQETSAKTNPTPNVTQKESNTPNPQQEQLNRELIAEAKKTLDRLVPNQPVGDRQWKHDKYTLTQKDGVTSVYVAETNATIRQQGDVITGNARQKDVNALSKVNAVIDQQLGKSAVKQTEVEL